MNSNAHGGDGTRGAGAYKVSGIITTTRTIAHEPLARMTKDEADSVLGDRILTALSYANDDVVEAQSRAGEVVISPEERLALISDLLSDAYAAWERLG